MQKMQKEAFRRMENFLVCLLATLAFARFIVVVVQLLRSARFRYNPNHQRKSSQPKPELPSLN